MKRLVIPLLILAFILLYQPNSNAETKKIKNASFTIKVVYGVKADKEEFPKSLSDYEDALRVAAEPHEIKKFAEYSSQTLAATMNKESEKKLNILEYKLVIKPTKFVDKKLSVTISLIKIQTKKTKVLFKGKFSIKKKGILVIELGKHKDGILFVPIRLDSVS